PAALVQAVAEGGDDGGPVARRRQAVEVLGPVGGHVLARAGGVLDDRPVRAAVPVGVELAIGAGAELAPVAGVGPVEAVGLGDQPDPAEVGLTFEDAARSGQVALAGRVPQPHGHGGVGAQFLG